MYLSAGSSGRESQMKNLMSIYNGNVEEESTDEIAHMYAFYRLLFNSNIA
jgi:hypothetical protein